MQLLPCFAVLVAPLILTFKHDYGPIAQSCQSINGGVAAEVICKESL